MKANEAKLESDKRRLKEVLDASESRSVKLELQRRALEGELQRSRLGLSDREAQAQVLQERVDSLQRQVGPPDLPEPRRHGGPALPAALRGSVCIVITPFPRWAHGGSQT